MTDLINGRTPEEIKKWLQCCFTPCSCYGECPYYCDKGDIGDCTTELANDALALIQHIEAQQLKWISVEERLPEPFVSVQVHMPGERPHPTVREGYISSEGIWVAGYFKRESDEVTHWAEMPEPPKEAIT